jgi:hypothetical protein
MRKHEEKFPASKRKSRNAFLKRLWCTALRLPEEYVNKTIGDLHSRCAKLRDAKGGHIVE